MRIEESGLLQQFPGRTAADLLVWLSANRAALLAHYGEYEHLSDLLAQVADDQHATGLQRVARQVMRLMGRDFPADLPAMGS